MTDQIQALLRDVRGYLIEHRDDMLDSYCVHDEAGQPLRDTMDPAEVIQVEQGEALIKEIGTTLAQVPA